ncbi:unnamed protein product [Xylocopa violacea]|uniref:Secreted protein n=1 Tax=Xylocopa violacea TaxID=135666 RepID=A0ABP1NZV2_XYLVO
MCGLGCLLGDDCWGKPGTPAPPFFSFSSSSSSSSSSIPSRGRAIFDVSISTTVSTRRAACCSDSFVLLSSRVCSFRAVEGLADSQIGSNPKFVLSVSSLLSRNVECSSSARKKPDSLLSDAPSLSPRRSCGVSSRVGDDGNLDSLLGPSAVLPSPISLPELFFITSGTSVRSSKVSPNSLRPSRSIATVSSRNRRFVSTDVDPPRSRSTISSIQLVFAASSGWRPSRIVGMIVKARDNGSTRTFTVCVARSGQELLCLMFFRSSSGTVISGSLPHRIERLRIERTG